MKTSKSLFIDFHRLTTLIKLIPISIALFLANESKLLAQVKATNGDAKTIVNSQGSQQFNITGGTTSGTGNNQNLFHSFDQFNLSKGQIANFLSNPNIRNILGKIVGGSPSLINGLIQVTGGNSNLFLMNPSGFVFGTNASLNVPGNFTVTTANGISFNGNNWFSASGTNNYSNLTGDPNGLAFAIAGTPGAIINAGNLTVPQGKNILLMGGTAINTGTVTAREGQIVITAVPGQKFVNISFPGNLLSLNIEPLASGNQPNIGNISVTDLPTLLTTGKVGNLTANSDGSVNIDNSKNIPVNPGTNIVSGTLDVSSPNVQGGTVAVLGTDVSLNGAKINASGNNGGGTVLIGGDKQGKGTVPNAQTTVVDQNSLINADAITNGNGGKVIVWSDDKTKFAGSITAQGGSQSGNGGFVETSGKNVISIGDQANVNTFASQGELGTWLLDPTDLTVESGGSGTITSGTNSTADSTIDPGTIVTALNGADVNLSAGTSITVKDAIDASSNTKPKNGNLTFSSPTINISNNITTTGSQTYSGAVNLANNPVLKGNGITFAQTVDSSTTGTSGSNLTVNAGTTGVTFTGKVGNNQELGNISLTADGINLQNNISGTGNITLQQSTATQGISVHDYSNNSSSPALTINSIETDLSKLQPGFNNVIIGNNNSNTTLTINSAKFQNPVTIQGKTITLDSNTTIDTSTTGGNITLIGPVDAKTAGSQTLTLNAGTAGNISVTGDIGKAQTLKSLSIGSAQEFSTSGSIITTDAQTYNVPVNLTGNSTFTGNGITFNSTVNSNSNSNLTANAGTGNLTFTGAVTGLGDITAKSQGTTSFNTVNAQSLTTDTSGTTQINGDITTTNNQTYNDAVTLANNPTLAGNGITFSSTVNSNSNSNLTANAGTGNLTFTGAVTGLGDITAKSQGTTSFNTVNAQSLTTDTSGTTQINGDITTTNNQTYNDAVTLANNPTLAGNGITFSSTVNSNSNSNLTANAGTGNLTFTGAVTGLGDITAKSQGTTSFNTVNAQSLTTDTSGTTQINGDITTTNNQTYNDAVTLANNPTLTGNGITFNNTVDSNVNTTLTVVAGINGVTFSNLVGNSGKLGDISLTGDAINLSNNIINSGLITLQPFTSGKAIAVGTIGTSDTGLNISNADLGFLQNGSTGITINGAGNSNISLNAPSFSTPVTVNTGSNGLITANGITGTGNSSVTLNGTTNLNGNITTANQGITIKGNTTLSSSNVILSTGTGANITLNGNVNGKNGGENLTLAAGTGNVSVTGQIGSSPTLGSLTISGASNSQLFLSGGITTTGSQTYTVPITLTSTSTFNGNGITFTTVDTTNGANDLTVDAGMGNIGFTRIGSSSNPLRNITLISDGTGSTNIFGTGNITLQTSSPSLPITLGDLTNVTTGFRISTADLGFLKNGFTGITISNGTSGTSNITLNSPMFSVPLTVNASNGSITASGTLSNSSVTLNGITALNSADFSAPLTVTGSSITVNGITTTGNATVNLNGTTYLNSNISTNNQAITINGNTILGGSNSTLNTGTTGADIALNGTVNGTTGSENLSLVAGTGKVTLGGDIGSSTALGSLTVSSNQNLSLSGNVNTTGSQTYESPVLLSNKPISITGNGITFNNKIDGNADLTVNNGSNNLVFTSPVGSSNPLNSLTVNGPTQINVNITTSGSQTYQGAVSLANPAITLKGNAIAFKNTVDGSTALNIPGNLTIAGVVGGTTPLTSLTTQGTTQINNSVTTTGLQTYQGAVNVANNPVLTGNGINFSTTVDGSGNLTASAGTSDLVFTGIVGGTTPLGSLTANGKTTQISNNITTTGSQTYQGAVNVANNPVLTGNGINFNTTVDGSGNLTALAGTSDLVFTGIVGGTTSLGSLTANGKTTQISNNITTTGSQTYQGAVNVANNPVLTGNGINFNTTVDGSGNLTASAGTSDLVFTGIVGGATPLGSLTANGKTTQISNNITTTGSQTYQGAVNVANNPVLTGNGINFNTTVDGSGNLTASAGTSDLVFTGIVGGATPLGSLTANGKTTQISNNITTTGSQTYQGAVNVANNPVLTGNGINFNTTVDGSGNLTASAGTSNLVFTGTVGGATPLGSLTANGKTTQISNNITTTGSQTYQGAVNVANNPVLTGNGINFNTTVDGSGNLTASAGTSNLVFTGIVGGATPLGSLTANGKTTQISNNITTTGSQTYQGAVNVANNPVLTGNGINFNTTVDGSGNLTASAGTSDLVFTGIVGGATPLGSLTANGKTTQISNNITTTGVQTYQGTVNVANNPVLTGNGINFNTTVDGSGNLTASAGTSNLVFTGTVGETTPLGSLTANGKTTQISNNITTTGAQTYQGAVNVAKNPVLTGNGINFNTTVDGGGNLTAFAGTSNLVFTGIVGGATPLGSLTANGKTTQISNNITTTGAQTYQGAVNVAKNPVLTGNGINFNTTVDGGGNLTASAGTSNLVFTGIVGGATPLGSLTANGTTTSTTQINNNITTTSNQDYNNPVTFSGDSSLTGNNITFASTVRATTDGSPSVNITSSGIIGFNGLVGDNHQRLANLTTQGTGSTAIKTNNITTTGSQTYNNVVNLSGDTTLIADANGTGTGSFTFNGSQLNSNNHSLNVTAADVQLTGPLNLGSGNLTLQPSTPNHSIGIGEGATGVFNLSTSELNNINSTGNVTIGNSDHTGDINIGAANTPTNLTGKYNLTVTNKGNVNLNSNLTTQGDQTYNASLVVQNNATLQGNNIAINGNIDALADNKESLTVNSKVATILGNKSTEKIGGVNQLNSLTTGGTGTTTINTNVINTTGNQTYNENLQLGTNLTINSSNNGNVSFNNSLNSLTDSSKNPYSLTVNTGGMTNFAGLVGNNQPLASLSIGAQGSTMINNTQIKTQGNQSYGNTLLLGSDTTLSTANNGNITFNTTVDSYATAKNLTVQTGGITQFKGDVGDNNPLNSLTTIGQGSTQINGNVTTSGTSGQTYNNQVNVTGKVVTLTSNALSFKNSVSGVGNSLTLQPFTPTQAIALGGQSNSSNGILDLNSTSINSLQHGFSLITIGSTNGSGAITLNSDVTFKDPFILRSPVNDGTINTSGGNLIGIDNASATLQANQNITTGNITTAGNAINITSTNGAIDTSSGTLNSSSSTGNGGAITAFALNNINTGNINSSAIAGTAGKINITTKDRKIPILDLNAENLANGRISTGNIDASGATGGDTTIQSFSSLVTGKINSSGTSGNAGNVTLGPSNQSIQVDSIKAESSGGKGGNVDISTLVYFIAKDTFVAANGLNASISTLGSTSSGGFNLTNGASIFEVGNIPVNPISGIISGSGTMGAITTGETQLINVNIPGNYTAPKINISSQEPPPNIPTTTFLVGGLSANLQTATSATSGGASVDPETKNNTEFSNYLHRSDRQLSPTEITEKLHRLAGDSRLKPALIYATFKADPKKRQENSNQPKNVDNWSFPPASEDPTDKLVIKLYLPDEKPIEIPVDVTRQEIIRIQNEYSDSITSPRFDVDSNDGNKLYHWLIPSQVDQLLTKEKINNISFIMDADLRSLPLASLQYKDGDKYSYIVKKYSVGLMPSFSLTDIGDQLDDVNKINILAMGASKFTDQAPLPAAIEELKEIKKIWKAELLMETDFNLENFRKAFSPKYSIIHLATHGHFEPGEISNSYIQFGDTKIPLDQLRDKLNLSASTVKLMTMSACQTAKGDAKQLKEAELGFASVAAAAGVKTVLASLWYVNDLGTFGLMTSFYKHLQSPPLSKIPIKVLALQQAQQDMIDGKIRVKDGYLIVDDEQIKLPPELDTGDIDFSHPYYWSAFTMVGSPR